MDHRATTTPERFSAAYEQHLPAIVRYLGRRLGDSAAEDAAAEVFLRAFHHRDGDEARAAMPLPWLYAIAGNVISEHRRAERRRLKTIERLATEPATAPDGRDGPEISPELARALRKLPDADRDTLLLFAWGELSYEEVAGVLKIPVGTVRSRLARARRTLDGHLRPTTSTTLHHHASIGAQHA
jgi:RNA polymerase sigma factor (sigma-70 family)